MSANKEKLTRTELRHEAIEWAKTLLFAFAFAVVMRLFVFEFVIVEQSSMFPTLASGDRLCVFKISYTISAPHRGDISVIKINEETNYVKRVIGLPKETIRIENSVVYIDGKPLDESYLPKGLTFDDFGETYIEDGSYFVMGDNRPFSIDSRRSGIGLIEKKQFIGRVAFRLSPFAWFL